MSGDREFKQPALASWERLHAERDEWKARAEKADADRELQAASIRIALESWKARAVSAEATLDGLASLGVAGKIGAAQAERDRLQEQVEQAREILHELFTNAAINGRNNWAPVEAFLRAYPVASASGSPDTEPTG